MVATSLPSAAGLRERLRALPGGEELLAAAADIAPGRAFLVGGAVRDLLFGRRPRELDVVVEGVEAPFGRPAAQLAAALASRVGAHASVHEHERFGTAIVEWGGDSQGARDAEGQGKGPGEGGRIDIATARRERYRAPGALPEVEPASLAEDLRRRDFTVNALACPLGAPPGEPLAAPHALEELCAAPHALEDLRAGRLRVLHERSFIDDPTRLWRLARYRARLGFAVEERTARLAADAVAGGALHTVSLARIGAELRLALGEADAVAALATLERLGALAALHPRLRFDTALAGGALNLLASAAGGVAPGETRPDLLLLAVLLQPMTAGSSPGVESEMRALTDGMEFPAPERDLVLRAAIRAGSLAEELANAHESSEIYEIASRESLEGVALAGARGEPSRDEAGVSAHRWMTELRNVHLEITGEDLLAAGLAEGPEIGRRLQAALCAKLDGELADGREAELAVALRLR
jgi:tRNA nucleotidyltransferase (CCA-adding enzyme)